MFLKVSVGMLSDRNADVARETLRALVSYLVMYFCPFLRRINHACRLHSSFLFNVFAFVSHPHILLVEMEALGRVYSRKSLQKLGFS